MGRRLDWERASRRDLQRAATARDTRTQKNMERQVRLALFVEEHRIRCFKCDADRAEWAKSGTSKRGPWVICVPCVKAASR